MELLFCDGLNSVYFLTTQLTYMFFVVVSNIVDFLGKANEWLHHQLVMISIIFRGSSAYPFHFKGAFARRICQMQEICNSACEELDTQGSLDVVVAAAVQG